MENLSLGEFRIFLGFTIGIWTVWEKFWDTFVIFENRSDPNGTYLRAQWADFDGWWLKMKLSIVVFKRNQNYTQRASKSAWKIKRCVFPENFLKCWDLLTWTLDPLSFLSIFLLRKSWALRAPEKASGPAVGSCSLILEQVLGAAWGKLCGHLGHLESLGEASGPTEGSCSLILEQVLGAAEGNTAEILDT